MASYPKEATRHEGNCLLLFCFIGFNAMILRCTTVEEDVGKVWDGKVPETPSVHIGILGIAMYYANPEAGEDLASLTWAFLSQPQYNLHAHLRTEEVSSFLCISFGHSLICCCMSCKGKGHKGKGRASPAAGLYACPRAHPTSGARG